MTTRAAETPCELVVANATPATLRSNAVTKITLSTTFITPAIVKNISGDFVSPDARRMEAQKLYSMRSGAPQKYSLK